MKQINCNFIILYVTHYNMYNNNLFMDNLRNLDQIILRMTNKLFVFFLFTI